MIKAGIIGGAGYTAGELIRILLTHPSVEISFVMSNSHAGQPVYAVHKDLLGDTEIKFSKTPDYKADVVFLCLGHGHSRTFLAEHKFSSSTKIIDLSHDFRIKGDHGFVYGLPELDKASIKTAEKIANPGCFATGIQLALLPLAAAGLLKEDVHIHAITGSTGAGQNPTDTGHFSYRNNNLSIYKAFEHQHLAEIKQSLSQSGGEIAIPELNLIPLRGNFTRGIFISAYTNNNSSLSEVVEQYNNFYKDHPFTFISQDTISLKEVVNTNKCLLQIEKHQKKVLITSVVDNLLKGASGQAVQNMNLMFGLDETEGLKLKAAAF